jgi:hypothetical protein
MEAGSNASTIALRVVRGNEKRTQCLGVKLGHPVPGGNKYGDLVLQVEGISNLRLLNMVMRPAGLKSVNVFAGKEHAPYQQAHNCLAITKIWSWAPDGA